MENCEMHLRNFPRTVILFCLSLSTLCILDTRHFVRMMVQGLLEWQVKWDVFESCWSAPNTQWQFAISSPTWARLRFLPLTGRPVHILNGDAGDPPLQQLDCGCGSTESRCWLALVCINDFPWVPWSATRQASSSDDSKWGLSLLRN